jgi:pilus assembly protein Flp/PilA
MLRFFIQTIAEPLRAFPDNRGVASFEYVILAACIVAIVGGVFNAGTSDSIKSTLTNALNTVSAAVASAVGG